MKRLECLDCETNWEATAQPVCPACLARRWGATPDLVREKHDPRAGGVHDQYRSVVSHAFLLRQREVLEHASRNGAWYFDRHYGCFVHYTPTPLGIAPGVGIPAGRDAPDHALDSLLIAEADSAPHVFAVDASRMEAQIRVGEFGPIDDCLEPGCDNLAVPATDRCALHASPPLATESR